MLPVYCNFQIVRKFNFYRDHQYLLSLSIEFNFRNISPSISILAILLHDSRTAIIYIHKERCQKKKHETREKEKYEVSPSERKAEPRRRCRCWWEVIGVVVELTINQSEFRR